MKEYRIDTRNDKKNIYSGHIKLGGSNPAGDRIGFTNYYMEHNGRPFFGICGEFHFSRYDESRWEDELIKMKMGGVNIVATYIFWNFHEEIQGEWDWSGNKNLRKFIKLCGKLDLSVIIRIGPFCHGEVRNGGIPDWLFGRPFEVRSNDEGYLAYAKLLYHEIGKQVKGLLYKDGGPIIGTQLENEHNHAGSPWTHTTGVSDMWMTAGSDGEAHLLKLKEIALEAGIDTPFYTCTAWGGATMPYKEMLPLWGGYAYWPWIFYEERHGSPMTHPATPEYIFRDKHNNDIPKSYNFEPTYPPEDYPYACCEMGGGMTMFYKYRFYFPYASVPAMAGIKVAEGCNFIGYYMFHGGTNPKGKRDTYLNEASTPKVSYDYNAPIGEFGQLRDSYRKIKLMHYFFHEFEEFFCRTKTILPCDTSKMDPYDVDTLRYAVRSSEGSGLLFLNNFQDHVDTKPLQDISITVELENESIRIPEKGDLRLGSDNSCMLPYNFKLDGILLKYATAQLITRLESDGTQYYFFFIPEGMNGEYCIDAGTVADVTAQDGSVERTGNRILIRVGNNKTTYVELHSAASRKIILCTMTERQSLNFWKAELFGRDRIILTDTALLAADGEIRLEVTEKTDPALGIFPALPSALKASGAEIESKGLEGIFETYRLKVPKKGIPLHVEKPKQSKAVLHFEASAFEELKEVLLQVDYAGDIGYAYIDGDLINDNFCNNTTWEIGLKQFEERLYETGMYLYISPILENKRVHSDTTMAGWSQTAGKEIAEIRSIRAVPVYEVSLKPE